MFNVQMFISVPLRQTFNIDYKISGGFEIGSAEWGEDIFEVLKSFHIGDYSWGKNTHCYEKQHIFASGTTSL